MTSKWRLLNLSELPWIKTQSVYHAVSLIQDEFGTPNTLILTWPNQAYVCIGLHQIIDLSVELEYIKSNNLPYVRRATGGGSVYLDQNQVFYQIICKKEDYPLPLEDFYKTFLEPVVKTYREYAIPAEYTPINDIIADDRKISGNGAVSFGKSRVLVGNFIFDFPALEMSKILKVPDEKFRDKIAKSLTERMGSFTYFLDPVPTKNEVVETYLEYFQKILDIEFYHGTLSDEELEKMSEIEKLYSTKEWVYYVEKKGDELLQQKIKSGTYFSFRNKKFPGGLVQIFLNSEKGRIKEIIISGDFTISPPYILPEIELELVGKRLDEEVLLKVLLGLYSTLNIETPGITPMQIAGMIVEIYEKTRK
ncbi:MAG: hypothetical protein KAS63_02950 [Candidatus Heimdallarchaeota archaeon]|nr:hypothetical protein [Candidatus Heimdallarchaeota archaeon]MCK4954294.1 hypothetical protein [Candidatus Heimdallarchaeota archaeon]